jgi:hypothetical protein
MDDLERMAREAEKFDRASYEKKKKRNAEEVRDYEFRTLLDAVELLFELRAKREKSIKDTTLIKIIENALKEEPFEYMDDDFILSAFQENSNQIYKRKKRW